MDLCKECGSVESFWTYLEPDPENKNKFYIWVCRCKVCGEEADGARQVITDHE